MTKTAVMLILFGCSISPCQTPAKEPDALQALLTEVHLLRQDLEAVTIASQRVQIALYSLQMQDAAVARAAQRADEARNKCAGLVSNRDRMTAEIQNIGNNLTKGTVAPEEAKMLQRQVTQMKSEAESQNAAVQSCQAAESDASTILRTDQAKLAELQDRIERLDKTLEKLGVDRK